ncbi:MAG: aldehyde dehydrogenase family protein [Bacteroidales bacterium]|nr:aldehyde dehydrogenase family protein [Bacteroidales bacterium]
MKTYKIYLAGEFVETTETLEVCNPYSKEIFAQTYLAGEEIINKAILAGLEAEKEMKQLNSLQKYEILMQISNDILGDKKRLAAVLSKESGKPMRYALGEIARAAQTFLVAAEESKRLPKEYLSLDWTAAGQGKEGLVKYFPIGLIAGIAPFNFPLNLAVHKIAPAIAAGNPIILKPARSTPLSVLELAKIIDKTDLPKGAISILPTDRVAGNILITDNRIKMLTFTGSPEVGWEMKKNAGKKKITLELGGNAGVIITETANFENALAKTLIGSFAYSGQVCIHVQRIFVQHSVFENFVENFIAKVKQLKVGDPLESSTDISVMIDEDNASRVESWVNEAKAGGAKVLCGGNRKDGFYEPTVLTNTKSEMKVCSLEIFGPVVTLEPFSDFNKAIDEINHSVYGLQAGVFTNKISEMDYAFDNLEVGGVVINDVPTFRVDHMPYGGVKNSGFGREGLKYAIHEMMEPRLLVKSV